MSQPKPKKTISEKLFTVKQFREASNVKGVPRFTRTYLKKIESALKECHRDYYKSKSISGSSMKKTPEASLSDVNSQT